MQYTPKGFEAILGRSRGKIRGVCGFCVCRPSVAIGEGALNRGVLVFVSDLTERIVPPLTCVKMVKVVKVKMVIFIFGLCHLLTIIIYIYYYSGGFWQVKNDFDQMTK